MKDRIRKIIEAELSPEARTALEKLEKADLYTQHCMKLKFIVEAVANAEFLADDIKHEVLSKQFDLLRRVTEMDFLSRILKSLAGIRDDRTLAGLSGEEGLAITALALIGWRDKMAIKASKLEGETIALTIEHLVDLFPEVAQELTK
jgi:hypothetical protein